MLLLNLSLDYVETEELILCGTVLVLFTLENHELQKAEHNYNGIVNCNKTGCAGKGRKG